MDGDKFSQAFRDEQRRKDEALVHSMQQLAFGSYSAGSILSAASITDASTLSAASITTNIYATSGVLQPQPYYNKEVDDAALFMDNKLKISAFNMYTLCSTADSIYKFDDMSHISSRYAITEYFNIIYHDKLLTSGSKCSYAINDTKNVIKHLNFLTQAFENIVQHKGSFPIFERIASKWADLHKALI